LRHFYCFPISKHRFIKHMKYDKAELVKGGGRGEETDSAEDCVEVWVLDFFNTRGRA